MDELSHDLVSFLETTPDSKTWLEVNPVTSADVVEWYRMRLKPPTEWQDGWSDKEDADRADVFDTREKMYHACIELDRDYWKAKDGREVDPCLELAQMLCSDGTDEDGYFMEHITEYFKHFLE